MRSQGRRSSGVRSVGEMSACQTRCPTVRRASAIWVPVCSETSRSAEMPPQRPLMFSLRSSMMQFLLRMTSFELSPDDDFGFQLEAELFLDALLDQGDEVLDVLGLGIFLGGDEVRVFGGDLDRKS